MAQRFPVVGLARDAGDHGWVIAFDESLGSILFRWRLERAAGIGVD